MFFAKALGGALAVVFGALYAVGFFDTAGGGAGDDPTLTAVNLQRQAELAKNKSMGWGPGCDELRDKVFGVEGGAPMGLADQNAMKSIAKLHAANRKLEAAGCNVNKAPGAFNPFTPESNTFKPVVSEMEAVDPYEVRAAADDEFVDPYAEVE